MKKLPGAFLLLSLCMTGCVFVRPKASTVLTMRPAVTPDKSASIGFREGVWTSTEDGTVVLARGWHPREHETYSFFVNEPNYGVGNPRWVMLSPTDRPGSYILDLWFSHNPFQDDLPPEPAHYTGTVNFTHESAGGTFRLRLKDQELHCVTGEARILVSGSLVAEPESLDTIEQRIEYRKQEMQNKTTEETSR